MDLKQIRYFLSVAETLNFTQASEINGISQPALTKAVQKIENEFGGRLIVRDGKNTRLTELGQKLRNEFSNIVASEVRARELATDHLSAGHSILNIGIANSLGPAMFTEFLGEFLQQNRNIRIVLHQIDQTMSDEGILSGFLDACICTRRHIKNHKLKSSRLFVERLMLAASQEHAWASQESVTLEQLTQEQYLDRLNCEFRPDFLRMIDSEQLDIESRIQSDREDWVQKLVAAGHGICALGEFSKVVPGICLRPLVGVKMSREVVMSSIFGSSASRATLALADHAEKYEWHDQHQ
jgi:DNA-binding transcriptional LysR family regulator